jgi:hypothetical protein
LALITLCIHFSSHVKESWDIFFYLYACTDPQKQAGGPAILEEPAQHPPIGLHIAITAATVMAGTLGGAQTVMQSNQNGLQSQPALASDPLTLHLAKMSRNQLNEIMSELKVRSRLKVILFFLLHCLVIII